MIGIEQKKGDDEKLCGRMIAYAKILPTPDTDDDNSPFDDMIKNGLLVLEGDFRTFNPTVPSRNQKKKIVDEKLNDLIPMFVKNGYEIIVTADHGNCERLLNEDGSVCTTHTTNLVPFIVITDRDIELTTGRLGNVAPTVLELMGLEIPSCYEHSLIKK